ncbi:hypothetical protein [Kribbella sindirgiensis]|uniref:Thymidylate kinase-like domain-containing protein n=1 Tax=Kribbella sindirgiensis TaxID=1124744 RepID=A0A4R0IPL3_9ACTN|nr:hypothetical protein [Kribbella sindirgiensis]TCC34929.1 hypothetical protein E0H50_13645 [Kribbella sindirgiensis]
MSLATASAVADRTADLRLKLLVLYLQLCMFGPIERFWLDACAPDVLVADRHPVIDGPTYLPVFSQRLASASGGPDLSAVDPIDLDRILWWADAQASRLGRSLDPGQLIAELVGLGELDDGALLREVPAWLNCGLPDLVLQFVVPPEAAAARLQERGDNRELHENVRTLAVLDARYDAMAGRLDQASFRRLDACQSPETVAELARQAIDEARAQLC